MNERGEPRLAIRTAVAADLPELQQVYRAASLSNAGDAPMLLARPEFLVFTGDGIAAGRTLVAVAGPSGNDRVVGFATVASGQDDSPELEDLFVDPAWRRRGIARQPLWVGEARTAFGGVNGSSIGRLVDDDAGGFRR